MPTKELPTNEEENKIYILYVYSGTVQESNCWKKMIVGEWVHGERMLVVRVTAC